MPPMPYYDIAPGWMVRAEWLDYLAFQSKNRSLVRLNKSAYSIFHALIGKSIEEAVNVLGGTYLVDDAAKVDVAKAAGDLVGMGILIPTESRPSVRPGEVKAVSSVAVPTGATDMPYLRTPESVLWSVTNRCNLRCRYCAPAAGPHVDSELPFEELDHVRQILSAEKVFEVILTGGEALLRRRDTLVLLERLHAANHFVHLLSNGLVVDQGIVDALLAFNVGIGVSLDGPDEETNSVTRGAANFSRVTKSLALLARAGVFTTVLTVLTRENFASLERHFQLLHELGIRHLILQPLRPSGRGRGTFTELRPTRAQLMELPSMLERLKSRFADVNVDDIEIASWGRMIREDRCPGSEPRKAFSCGAAVRFCVIDEKANIAPCNALLDIQCGNLLQNGLQRVWHTSKELGDLRVLATKSVCVVATCSECRLNWACDGGCRADAFHATGSWTGQHPYCLDPADARHLDTEALAAEPRHNSGREHDRPLSSIVTH